MVNELMPSIIWTDLSQALPTVREACGAAEETEDTTTVLGEASEASSSSTSTIANQETRQTMYVNWYGNPQVVQDWKDNLVETKHRGKWTKADKYWQATGLPCSNTLAKCRGTPGTGTTSPTQLKDPQTGKTGPGCPEVGQCPCVTGKVDADGHTSLLDWVNGLSLSDSTQHFGVLYYAVAAITAHAVAALGNFGPDMGKGIEKKICVTGFAHMIGNFMHGPPITTKLFDGGYGAGGRGIWRWYNRQLPSGSATSRRARDPSAPEKLFEVERRRTDTMCAFQFANFVINSIPWPDKGSPNMRDWFFSAIRSSYKPVDRRDYAISRKWGMELRTNNVDRSFTGTQSAWQYSARRCKKDLPKDMYSQNVPGIPYAKLKKKNAAALGFTLGPFSKPRGMTFEALDLDTLVMRLPSKGCESKADWAMSVCKGCTCKKGFVTARLKHVLQKGNANKCSSWFAATDQFIHAYMANIRAALLVEKKLLCIMKSKTARRRQRIKGSVPKARRLRAVPKGYTDVTKRYLSRMTGTCNLAVTFGRNRRNYAEFPWMSDFVGNPEYEDAFTKPNGIFPGIDKTVLRKLKRPWFHNKLVCADKNYSDEARLFSAQAGTHYVPPSIKATTVDGGAALSISCGGPILTGALTWAEDPKCAVETPREPVGRLKAESTELGEVDQVGTQSSFGRRSGK